MSSQFVLAQHAQSIDGGTVWWAFLILAVAVVFVSFVLLLVNRAGAILSRPIAN